ncbi:MAG: ABC transporter ATP-binding protein [Firmicutes bacterium]|jgi:NitT/TauT family transport system ATP-binding protein|nr:ABC transporter ATP-binding protein [Bacillota bacterium]
MSAVVSVQSVGMIYNTPEGETHALRDVTFDVAPGEFVSIVGPSGCGKSTLLSLICGLIRPTSGRVLIQGEAVEGPSRHVGYMLQSDYLFGWRTVLSNCLLGLEIRKERTPERVREVWELLELMGLKDFAHRYPYQLSGGMRQRAALVRTLALRPNVVLLDEPFGALDYQTRLHLEGEVAELLRSRGQTAILITHDIAEAISMSDRVIVLTHRPGTVYSVYTVRLSTTRRTPLAVRNAPEFNPLFQAVWKDLEAAQNGAAVEGARRA